MWLLTVTWRLPPRKGKVRGWADHYRHVDSDGIERLSDLQRQAAITSANTLSSGSTGSCWYGESNSESASWMQESRL
jgi:hypothetical protein